MNQGRGRARECDFAGRCHTPGPCPVLIHVATSVIESNEQFADAWTNHHRFLLDVAYRLLGSYSDAEDIVQEGFSRLLRTDLDPIEDLRAWLVLVVSRLCLDQLRSSRVKREAYIGPWFPEPLLFADDAAIDPADVVTMDESVRFALLVVLERMSPAERVVFVLHDVFDFPFEKIAPMVGRTAAACRQLASRARRRVQEEAGSTRFAIDPSEQRRVVSVRALSVTNGLISRVYVVSDERKLAHVKRVLELQTS